MGGDKHTSEIPQLSRPKCMFQSQLAPQSAHFASFPASHSAAVSSIHHRVNRRGGEQRESGEGGQMQRGVK